jgi:hypothetical protein
MAVEPAGMEGIVIGFHAKDRTRRDLLAPQLVFASVLRALFSQRVT